MTTVNLQFSIDAGRSRVYINAVHAPLTSSLASNISYVSFANGAGTIIYNDRPPIPESFTDPSPYQIYINQWLTAEAALLTNPLTLTQAQAIKCALVQAIGNVQAQAPVNVTVSAGNYNWSVAGNEALLGGQAWIAPLNTVITGVNAVVTTDVNGVVTGINTIIGSINSVIGAINTLITSINSNATSDKNSVNAAFSSLASNLNTQFTTDSINVVAPTETVSFATVGSSGLATLSTISSYSAPLTTLTAPSLSAVPAGSSTPIALTNNDLQAILSAMSSQSSTIQGLIVSKQAAVNALSTIASVIAYDAITGW